GLGLLYSTGGVGGLIAGLLIAGRGRPSTRVRMLGGGGLFYAAGLATLTQSHTLAMALPALVAISFGFLAMNTSMTTLLQTDTDPARRRRLPVLVPVVLALVAGGVVATTQVLGRGSSTPPRGPVAEVAGARIPASLFDLRLGSALTAIRQAGGAPEPGDPAYPAFLAG